MKKVNIQPLGDRLVIRSMEAEQKTASGIIIPDTAKEKPQRGTVIATGDKLESQIKINDTVLYGKYAGTEVELEGETYLIMNESDVLAIV
jgi:chaperonin GroES